MSAAVPLVDALARLLERTYDVEWSVVPIGRFVVGDTGHARLARARRSRERVDHARETARLLLRPLAADRAWAAALYLPDRLVERLERCDPRRELHDGNIDEFATLIEEIDHLVVFAERVRQGGPSVSLLELEWHAGVSKYLVLTHFAARLAGAQRLPREAIAFVEHHVFHKGRFVHDDPLVQERYRLANRLALRFVRHLRGLPERERLPELRRFHRESHHEKMRRFAA